MSRLRFKTMREGGCEASRAAALAGRCRKVANSRRGGKFTILHQSRRFGTLSELSMSMIRNASDNRFGEASCLRPN